MVGLPGRAGHVLVVLLSTSILETSCRAAAAPSLLILESLWARWAATSAGGSGRTLAQRRPTCRRALANAAVNTAGRVPMRADKARMPHGRASGQCVVFSVTPPFVGEGAPTRELGV